MNEIKINEENDLPKVVGNIFPAHINYTGFANTHNFLTKSKKIEKIENSEFHTVYFRGNKFFGNKLDLKKSFKGYILNKNEKTCRSEKLKSEFDINNNIINFNLNQETIFDAVLSIDEIFNYHNDKNSCVANRIEKINEWKDISEILF